MVESGALTAKPGAPRARFTKRAVHEAKQESPIRVEPRKASLSSLSGAEGFLCAKAWKGDIMGKGGSSIRGITGRALGSIVRYLVFVTLMSATAAVVGYARTNGDFGSIAVMIQGIEDLAVNLRSKPLVVQWLSVFAHNMRVIVILVGVSWVPVVPVMAVALMNSIMLGAMLKATAVATGIPAITVLVGLLPHGIFELTAFMIGTAMCLRIGMLMPLWVGKAIDTERMKKAGYDVLVLFFAVIVPLLLVASLIEVTISAWLASVLAR